MLSKEKKLQNLNATSKFELESYEFKNKDFIDIFNKITPLFHYQKVYLDLLIEKSKRGSDKE